MVLLATLNSDLWVALRLFAAMHKGTTVQLSVINAIGQTDKCFSLEELSHPNGTLSRTAALPHHEELTEVVWTTVQVSPEHLPPKERLSACQNGRKSLGQTRDMLERLHLLVSHGLEIPWCSPRGGGGSERGKEVLGFPAGTAVPATWTLTSG